MESEMYSEEILQTKKYGDLLKIAKSIGANSGKRLKTAKLIEAILEAQATNCIAKDATAIAEVLGESTIDSDNKDQAPMKYHEQEVLEELLSDIQFPEHFKQKDSGSACELLSDIQFPEEGLEEAPKSKGRKENTKVESNGTLKRKDRPKRRRTETFEVDDKVIETNKEATGVCHTKNRTGTFDVEADENQSASSKPKRSRTSTFEVLDKICMSNLPSEGVGNDAAEENGQQLQVLSKRLSEKQNHRASSNSPLLTSKVSDSKKRKSSMMNKTKDQAPSKVAKSSRMSTTTPASKTPTAEKPTEKGMNKSSVRKSTIASVMKLSSATPRSAKKELQASKITKSIFTIGRGGDTASGEGTEESKPTGSNIPRFVTFARKLKVPNFAKIHEKAFNRMMALDDYVARKRNMSELSNSSKKAKPTPSKEEVFKPAVTKVENLNLNFSDSATASSVRVGKIPLPKSVKSSSNAKTSQVSQRPVKSPKHLQTKSAAKVACIKSPRSQARRSPRLTQSGIKAPAISASTVKSPAAAKLMSPKIRYSTLPRPLKENVKPARHSLASPAPGKLNNTGIALNTPGSMQKRKEFDPKATLNKPLNYVPYKGTLKPLNTADVRKAMSKKIPHIRTTKERREDQQKILKGVRFNKRFELQMAKRGITLN